MFYGSGRGEAESPTQQPQETPPDPFLMLNGILMAPLKPLADIMGFQLPGSEEHEKAKARYERSFLPMGGVRPKMSTTELRQKNIFGEGGTSY
jgi:hypothetical protein